MRHKKLAALALVTLVATVLAIVLDTWMPFGVLLGVLIAEGMTCLAEAAYPQPVPVRVRNNNRL